MRCTGTGAHQQLPPCTAVATAPILQHTSIDRSTVFACLAVSLGRCTERGSRVTVAVQQFSLLTVARPSLCLQARHFNNFHHTSGIPVLSYLYSYIHFVPLRKRRWRFVSFSILGTLLICLHTVLRRFPPSCLHSILSVTPLRPFLLLHASAVVPAIFLEGVCEACVKRNREKRLVFGPAFFVFLLTFI